MSPFAPMTLECRYAGEVVTGIQWLKPNADVMMRCDNSSRKCVLDERVKDKDNYVIRYSRNSVILTLRKLDPRQHIGVWACRDGETGLTAKCTNQLTSKCLFVFCFVYFFYYYYFLFLCVYVSKMYLIFSCFFGFFWWF